MGQVGILTVQSKGDRDPGTLGTDPDYRMAIMDFESAATFSSSVVNMISGNRRAYQFTVPAEQQLGVTKEGSPPCPRSSSSIRSRSVFNHM
jgi:hypothetical protein